MHELEWTEASFMNAIIKLDGREIVCENAQLDLNPPFYDCIAGERRPRARTTGSLTITVPVVLKGPEETTYHQRAWGSDVRE